MNSDNLLKSVGPNAEWQDAFQAFTFLELLQVPDIEAMAAATIIEALAKQKQLDIFIKNLMWSVRQTPKCDFNEPVTFEEDQYMKTGFRAACILLNHANKYINAGLLFDLVDQLYAITEQRPANVGVNWWDESFYVEEFYEMDHLHAVLSNKHIINTYVTVDCLHKHAELVEKLHAQHAYSTPAKQVYSSDGVLELLKDKFPERKEFWDEQIQWRDNAKAKGDKAYLLISKIIEIVFAANSNIIQTGMIPNH